MKQIQIIFLFIFLYTTIKGSSKEDFIIEEEFKYVTCGSTIKLTHKPTGFKLHSHSITYGSGSGQQSVTAISSADDVNSYWIVEGAFGKERCVRGEAIKCNQHIRVNHLQTKKHLHSHAHVAPLSSEQEVSAYEHTNIEDNFMLRCLKKNVVYWERESEVRLQHVQSSKYLSSNQNHQYRHPIPGQLEVCGTSRQSENEIWIAQEGIYFSTSTY
ncbi:Stromal cell-derived factor 2-like protein 1 [Clydaea vesicula]|uniref:Stromal cell-derived factor 2-like protein 1 n=1 Tax=Clydaea vesicula TaxID=447962 RepID=A0AAD5U5Q0_9FUNG|nr:Stromal cell-derived factor 2-like protein 1 [Clydaea vesicula]KAJ3396845.1 Stromal cell-derived factor 2-like protein 1 [Lobulomyces angularis]